MKNNLSLLSFLLGLILIITSESFGFSEKQKFVLNVNKIGYSQLEYESAYKDIGYDVNFLYTECVLNSFNDHGLIPVKYLPVILIFSNPNTEQIRDLCYKFDLDAYLVTKIRFGLQQRKGSLGKEKIANPVEIFISVKLYNKEGGFIDSVTYKSPKVLWNENNIYQETIMEESVDAVVTKLIKYIAIQPNGFNISQVTQQTWQSFKILLKNGTPQEIKRAARLNLCLYNNRRYYLESIPDSSKKIHDDKYDYNPTNQEIILHSNGEDLTFSIIGSNDDLLVLKPKNIENINKIYFRKLSDSEIAELLKPEDDSIRSVTTSVDPITGKTTREVHAEKIDGPIYFVVEESATFQGGDLNHFREWVLHNTRYPEEAQQKGLSGKAIVQFIVTPDGTLRDIKVIRSAGSLALDKEAIRVISTSPKWKPGQQGGKVVNQLFTMPVSFVIN
jgi:TonB family protein